MNKVSNATVAPSINRVPLQIDIVSDVVCPWCVIGYQRLQRALATFEDRIEAKIHWYPFELNPQMPPEGENLREHLAKKYGTSERDSIAARERLTALGAAVGFTFDYSDDMRVLNTFNAHQLLHWSKAFERESELCLRLFQDFFSERKNIADTQVLIAAAAVVGLDPQQAEQILRDQTYADVVRSLESQIVSQGIQGVPLFIFNHKTAISGAQEVATFEQQLQQLIDQGRTGNT
jgi:predicted DsbA family dithiol-disulfide isomerase